MFVVILLLEGFAFLTDGFLLDFHREASRILDLNRIMIVWTTAARDTKTREFETNITRKIGQTDHVIEG